MENPLAICLKWPSGTENKIVWINCFNKISSVRGHTIDMINALTKKILPMIITHSRSGLDSVSLFSWLPSSEDLLDRKFMNKFFFVIKVIFFSSSLDQRILVKVVMLWEIMCLKNKKNSWNITVPIIERKMRKFNTAKQHQQFQTIEAWRLSRPRGH